MRITKVRDLAKHIETLDNLDKIVMPADIPYPKQGSTWWLVWDKDMPMGFCGLKRWNESTGFLCRAGVLRGARGAGLHRRLLRTRERSAKVMGITLLVTYVAGHNPKSANNLIKCGYTIYVPQVKWGGDGCIYFRKTIR